MSRPRDRQTNPIEEAMLGLGRVQALYVAVKLGIPDLLADAPCSSTLLASTTGVHPGALHRLLRFLAAEGYVALTEDGRFALTAQGEPLTTRSKSGMAEYVLSTATRGWEVWSHLPHSVETGQPAFERVFGRSYFAEQRENGESLSRFDAALAPSAAETGKALGAILQPARCIVDLGCGSGEVLYALLRTWPAARGLAFDAPAVLELARLRAERAKVHERVEFVPGDFLAHVPPGGDLYILSLVIHDWENADCLRLLRNCHAAMAPGARLVIIEQLMPEDPRESPRVAHADLGMLAMTGGRERTLAEYRSLLERAGLRFDGARALKTRREVAVIEASRGLL
ncbi:MAG: methyltransferase [Dehalococcoidia bacterium]